MWFLPRRPPPPPTTTVTTTTTTATTTATILSPFSPSNQGAFVAWSRCPQLYRSITSFTIKRRCNHPYYLVVCLSKCSHSGTCSLIISCLPGCLYRFGRKGDWYPRHCSSYGCKRNFTICLLLFSPSHSFIKNYQHLIGLYGVEVDVDITMCPHHINFTNFPV